MPKNNSALKKTTFFLHLKKKKIYRIKTVLKSCYLIFGGALISINFHLLFHGNCFNLIILKILKNVLGNNCVLPDRQ